MYGVQKKFVLTNLTTWGTFSDIGYSVLSYMWELLFTRLPVLAWCVSFLYSRELAVWKFIFVGSIAVAQLHVGRLLSITPYPHLPGVCFRPRLVCGSQCDCAVTRCSQVVWQAKDKLVRLHDEASSQLATLTFFCDRHVGIVLAQPLWLALKSPLIMSWWVMVLDTTVKSAQFCVLSFHLWINTTTSLLFSIIVLRVSKPAAIFLIPRCDLSLVLEYFLCSLVGYRIGIWQWMIMLWS